MRNLELWLFGFTLIGLLAGTWGITWARTAPGRGRASWGRLLFVFTLLLLGGASLLAAFHRAEGLVYLGLLAGGLVLLMVWDVPVASWHDAEVVAAADEI
jgi:hypothetical protein